MMKRMIALALTFAMTFGVVGVAGAGEINNLKISNNIPYTTIFHPDTRTFEYVNPYRAWSGNWGFRNLSLVCRYLRVNENEDIHLAITSSNENNKNSRYSWVYLDKVKINLDELLIDPKTGDYYITRGIHNPAETLSGTGKYTMQKLTGDINKSYYEGRVEVLSVNTNFANIKVALTEEEIKQFAEYNEIDIFLYTKWEYDVKSEATGNRIVTMQTYAEVKPVDEEIILTGDSIYYTSF